MAEQQTARENESMENAQMPERSNIVWLLRVCPLNSQSS